MNRHFLNSALLTYFVKFTLCDEAPMEKIVGGDEATPGRYPYMVSIGWGKGTGAYNWVHNCGGSLVSPNWVLSAAHCACTFSEFVQIGRHDITNSTEDFEMIRIAETFVHPLYDKKSVRNDLVMFKLASDSSYPPVSLYEGSTAVGEDVTVMGWGRIEYAGSLSNELLEVELDIISNDDCDNKLDREVTEEMMCAARPGKDSCDKDSGGPLIFKGDDASSDAQVGVVSWGSKMCGYPDSVGVYALIDKDFVYGIINGEDVEACDCDCDFNPFDDPGKSPLDVLFELLGMPLVFLLNLLEMVIGFIGV